MPHPNDQGPLAKMLLGSTTAETKPFARTLAHQFADHLRIALAAEINKAFRERAALPGEIIPVAMAAQMEAAAALASEVTMGFLQIIDVQADVPVEKINDARSSGMSHEDFDTYCRNKVREAITKGAVEMPGLTLLTRDPLPNSAVGKRYRGAIAILPPFKAETVTTKPLPMPGQAFKLGGGNG